jgi:hypothetical protein
MSINSHLSTCVGTQSPKYLEMAQGHISLSVAWENVARPIELGGLEVLGSPIYNYGLGITDGCLVGQNQ